MRWRGVACARLLLVFGFLLPGCGGPKPGEASADYRAVLEEIAQVYKDFRTVKKRAPARLADLRPFDPVAPSGLMALENGECVVAVWGAGLSDTADASNAVLVYEKNVPQQGGYVLMQDGKVRSMTAQEFQAAPKAKK